MTSPLFPQRTFHHAFSSAALAAVAALCGVPAMPAMAADADATVAPAPLGDVVLPTVSVTGEGSGRYRARQASVAGFDEAPLLDTPASVTVVTQEQLADQHAKRLSDIVRNDASVGNAYAPVGYYEGFTIRGFPIDLASAIEINNLAASGEQTFGLENKERVEILKGLAGIESGVIAPGGEIN
ncbi:MAG: TonB-dependent receptor plug domain-containing protein, partial [Janthinobacterium lividum]